MTPIDPPSEGQAPRAASAGRVQPPPGLLDKVAEAMFEVEYPKWSEDAHPDSNRWSWRGDGFGEDVKDHYRAKACAAWDAVVEGLGLEWQRGSDEVPGRSRWRHLVSRWEPKP